jgi:hypothetical protein
MLIDEECMAKTTDSEKERQEKDYYEGVFDETGATLSPPPLNTARE